MWMSTNATKGVFIYQFRLNYSGERALQSLLKGLTPSSYNAWMPRVESIVLSSVRASITPVRKMFVPADGFPTLPCIDKKNSESISGPTPRTKQVSRHTLLYKLPSLHLKRPAGICIYPRPLVFSADAFGLRIFVGGVFFNRDSTFS